MPFVSFSPRDVKRGTPVSQPAWYRVKIESVGEGEPSKDKQSTNYGVEGTIIKNADTGDETDAGIPLDWQFNSKAISFAIGFLKAFGVDVQPNVRFDLAAAAGQELDVFVEHDTWQGRTVNRVNHKYRHKDYATQTPA